MKSDSLAGLQSVALRREKTGSLKGEVSRYCFNCQVWMGPLDGLLDLDVVTGDEQ